jgi:hypothetical protein
MPSRFGIDGKTPVITEGILFQVRLIFTLRRLLADLSQVAGGWSRGTSIWRGVSTVIAFAAAGSYVPIILSWDRPWQAVRSSASRFTLKQKDGDGRTACDGPYTLWTARGVQEGFVRYGLGSNAVMCPAFDARPSPLAQMGSANDIQTAGRHIVATGISGFCRSSVRPIAIS